ncbi:uncharacterized protein LOC131166683 [Malania oleifera]|uniref:uncharacterized protein LOC131166683 n=1 Tax=Malania oleifera TaxID=397392 RepID=UPI0025AE6EEC|nr:uncharacterized protein LOC131166683 [Malania oleifera]
MSIIQEVEEDKEEEQFEINKEGEFEEDIPVIHIEVKEELPMEVTKVEDGEGEAVVTTATESKFGVEIDTSGEDEPVLHPEEITPPAATTAGEAQSPARSTGRLLPPQIMVAKLTQTMAASRAATSSALAYSVPSTTPAPSPVPPHASTPLPPVPPHVPTPSAPSMAPTLRTPPATTTPPPPAPTLVCLRSKARRSVNIEGLCDFSKANDQLPKSSESLGSTANNSPSKTKPQTGPMKNEIVEQGKSTGKTKIENSANVLGCNRGWEAEVGGCCGCGGSGFEGREMSALAGRRKV